MLELDVKGGPETEESLFVRELLLERVAMIAVVTTRRALSATQ